MLPEPSSSSRPVSIIILISGWSSVETLSDKISSKPILVLYTGNIGYAQELMTLVKVAQEENTLNVKI